MVERSVFHLPPGTQVCVSDVGEFGNLNLYILMGQRLMWIPYVYYSNM